MKCALPESRQKILTTLLFAAVLAGSSCTKKTGNSTGSATASGSTSPSPTASIAGGSSSQADQADQAGDTQALIAEFADDMVGVDPPTAEGIAQMIEEKDIILNANIAIPEN